MPGRLERPAQNLILASVGISAGDIRWGGLSSLTLPGGGSQNHQPAQIGPGPLSFMAASRRFAAVVCVPAPIEAGSLTAGLALCGRLDFKAWFRGGAISLKPLETKARCETFAAISAAGD